jgi:hypothetical protein
MEDTQTLGE